MLNFRLPLSWLFCVRSLSSFSLLVLKQIKFVHSFQVCLDWGSWLTIWNVFPGTSETIGTLYQSGALWHQSMDQLEQDPFLICRPTTTMCNLNIGWNDGNWYCFFSVILVWTVARSCFEKSCILSTKCSSCTPMYSRVDHSLQSRGTSMASQWDPILCTSVSPSAWTHFFSYCRQFRASQLL